MSKGSSSSSSSSSAPNGGGAERRQPQQSRSQETYGSILEAAAALFSERGYDQTTTHQIAAEAGVSVGALYRYFDGKPAILRELYAREISGLRSRVLEEFSLADLVSKDIPALLRKTIALAFKIYAERPGLRRVLAEQTRKIPELVELRRALEVDVHRAVRQILQVAPGVTLEEVEVGAYLVTLFVESLMDDYVLYRREHIDFGDERVIEAASDLLLRYVVGRVDGR
jgi:AcrR family transcriptional regulator